MRLNTKQHWIERGCLPISYFHNMARLFWLIGLLSCSAGSLAQQDSARAHGHPWVEASFGVNSPSGHAGLGVGFPVSPRLYPVLAAGFGGVEGKQLSGGIEYIVLHGRETDFGAFGYWTWTTGRQSDKYFAVPRYSTTSSAGEMLKFGASITQDAGAMLFCLRAGYAWYTKDPVTSDASGVIGLAEASHKLTGGPVLGFSIRIPFSRHNP